MKILNEKDKDLLKVALSRTLGNGVIQGELGEFEFIRGVSQSGKYNSGKVIQLVTQYIIWSHGIPKQEVSMWGYIDSHPLMTFIKSNSMLVNIVPEVITHLIESQDWVISKYNLEDYSDYIPETIERRVNIE